MTGKEFMFNIKQIRRTIRLLEEQIYRDSELATGVTAIRYDKDKVQTSPVSDRLAEIVAKIIETTDKLKDAIHDLQIAEEEARGYLVQLKEEHERALSYHYLDALTWKEVANRMGYDSTYIYELKDAALMELDTVISKTSE